LQVDRLWSRPVAAGPLGFEMTCVRFAPAHADGETPIFVPVDQFTRSVAGASAVSLAPGGQSVRVRTNRSTYDWQALSDPIPVKPGGDYAASFTMTIEQGGMGVAVVDDRLEVLAARNWCMQKAEREAGLVFHAGRTPTIRIVLSNCAPAPRVSRFSVKGIALWHLRSDSTGS
jgi:hypothetical protein